MLHRTLLIAAAMSVALPAALMAQTQQTPDTVPGSTSGQSSGQTQMQSPAAGQPQIMQMVEQGLQQLPAACRDVIQPVLAEGQMGTSSTTAQPSSSGMNQQDMMGMDAAQIGQWSAASRGMHEAMMKSAPAMLAGLYARDADVAFACSMIPHHQAAVDMANAVLASSDNTQSKRIAEGIIRDQQREINQLTAWVENQAARESENENLATGATSPAPGMTEPSSGSGSIDRTNSSGDNGSTRPRRSVRPGIEEPRGTLNSGSGFTDSDSSSPNQSKTLAPGTDRRVGDSDRRRNSYNTDDGSNDGSRTDENPGGVDNPGKDSTTNPGKGSSNDGSNQINGPDEQPGGVDNSNNNSNN
jgi:uncharacterized protein (DUF305 family)